MKKSDVRCPILRTKIVPGFDRRERWTAKFFFVSVGEKAGRLSFECRENEIIAMMYSREGENNELRARRTSSCFVRSLFFFFSHSLASESFPGENGSPKLENATLPEFRREKQDELPRPLLTSPKNGRRRGEKK